MNTMDIRNTEYNQRLFWTVSVPTTTFVIGVAYLYGYKWENWKGSLNRRRNLRRTERFTNHKGHPIFQFPAFMNWHRTASLEDAEKGNVKRQDTTLSLLSIKSTKNGTSKKVRWNLRP